jgi:Zinc carboxypeptidase
MHKSTRIKSTTILTLVCGASVSIASAQVAAPINADKLDLTKLNNLPRIDVRTHVQPRVYQEQMVIRVRTNTQAQLDAMLDLTESVWTERVGVGKLDIQIKRSNLDAITKLGIPHDVLIDDLQAHADASWAQVVELKQLELDNPNNQRGATVHDDAWFSNYKQLAEIITYYNNIATLRPELASFVDVGDSVEGNDIHALTITGPDAPGNAGADRPVVLWHGATHAREWVSPMTVAYLASKFVDSYDTDPRVAEILDNARIVIVPVTNPDGYLYTWSDERFWRKNRQNNGGTFGVDINRNWGYEWGGQGASSSPGDDTYHGPSAFSEPETQTLRDLALSYGDDLVAHIDYHCYSQLILWPFGYAEGVVTPEPARTYYDNLATDLSNEILSYSGVFYNPIQSVDLYPAAGVSSDWFYGELDATSLTFELRPSSGGLEGFDPPPSIILPTAQENYEAAKLFVERTTQLISLSAPPLSVAVANEPTPVTLTVSNGIGEHDVASPTLFARIGSAGAFDLISMSSTGNGSYSADLPAAACGAEIEYYFGVDTTESVSFLFPPTGSAAPLSVTAQQFSIAFEDDMESDTGWTVGAPGDTASTGLWNRQDPQGTDAQPENDATVDGTDCWVTDGQAGSGLGDRDIDNGATTLTSPQLDAIFVGDEAELVYSRWYSNDAGASPDSDSMLVQISSDNGVSWVDLETVTENAGRWVEKRFRIADFDTPTDQIRIRFIASDFGDGSIVEAGVDDLRIESVGCLGNSSDINNDGVLNFFDISAFLEAFSNLDPIGDFNNDGSWNFFDISEFLSAFSQG